MKRLLCLGIEGTAHTFGVGIVSSDGEIIAEAKSSYIPPLGRGIQPREASQHHSRVADEVLKEAFDKSGVKPREIDLIAFSQGPGLGPCLRTAATVARALSVYLDKPLVGVNHLVAHIEIGRLISKAKDPLILILSGGTTQILGYEDGRYRVFGETLDITLANCIDTFARETGIVDVGNPWPGPAFDKVASKGRNYINLPYTVKGMDLQFSGLLTAALKMFREKGASLEDLCFSLQETALSMVVEVVERALAQTGKREVLLTGGFARNQRIRDMIREMVKLHDAALHVVPHEYATDNGVMIAWTGILAYENGLRLSVEDSLVKPKWRIEDVQIVWMMKD